MIYLYPLAPWLVAAGLLLYFGLLAIITRLVLLVLERPQPPDYRHWMRAKALWTPYHSRPPLNGRRRAGQTSRR